MTLDEFTSVKDWSALEADLIRCAPLGRTAVLPGKRDCPEDTSDPSRRVRAGLIRFLLLGGGEGCKTNAKGVMLEGAWVEGRLDFQGEKTRLSCLIWKCLFPSPVTFADAELRGLYLSGCDLRRGLNLHRLKTETDVHLRDGCKARGSVDLVGARIDGELACVGSSFHSVTGKALNCNSAVIGAGVLLSDGFSAEGEVNLITAQIGGQLICEGGSFRNSRGAALDCTSTVIGADVFLRPGKDKDGMTVDCTIDGALDFSRATIKGRLQINNARLSGPVSLHLAEIGILSDNAASWEKKPPLSLDGLTYDRIDSSMSIEERLDWLAQNRLRAWNPETGHYDMPTPSDGTFFQPQPYTQLARVLAASGDQRAAAKVRETREWRNSRAEWWRAWARRKEGPWRGIPLILPTLKRGWDAFLWLIFGNGHRPGQAVWISILIIGLATWFYSETFKAGQMAPNSAVILTSADWLSAIELAKDSSHPPVIHWAGSRDLGIDPMASAKDYETFSAFLYAIDLFIPLVALGQQSAWAPSPTRGSWGKIGHCLSPALQLFGWLIAAMAAAVVTGLVGRSDDKR